jgi:Enoyl-[acyl-carrier-protein] reductase (NADH)
MPLKGMKGLVVGIANQDSIAYGCAEAFRRDGAEIAVTYLNGKAEPHVRPLAERLQASIIAPLDVCVPGQLEAVFETISQKWGKLDFVLHAIAFAPREDLHGRLVDASAEGFALTMDISCHSFLRMAKLAEPLMTGGGCLLTTSFYGAEKVVEDYNLMGPVKAALESAVRYMAIEMGGKKIRVNAISPGPVRTRAAGGIKNFDAMVERAIARAPEGRLVSIDDIGNLAAFLVSERARSITGNTAYVDAGYHLAG